MADPRIQPFAFQGFTWHFDNRWVSPDMIGPPVHDTMTRIWEDYVRPTNTNVLRLFIILRKYALQPTNDTKRNRNEELVARLVNLCRFAESVDIYLVPVLIGVRHYKEGVEFVFSEKVYAFAYAFTTRLREMSALHLRERILFFQIENEMNNSVRHRGWSNDALVKLTCNSCAGLKKAEHDAGAKIPSQAMVNFGFDAMPFRDQFLIKPRWWIPSTVKRLFYDTFNLSFFDAFATHESVDVIGVDFFPGTWSPLTTTQTLLELTDAICSRYGTLTPCQKRVVIAETGFTDLLFPQRREPGQLRYYSKVLELMTEYYWHGGGKDKGFIGLIWYCLFDRRIRRELLPPGEYRWGILKTIPGNLDHGTYPAAPNQVWSWLIEHVETRGENEGASLQSIREHSSR